MYKVIWKEEATKDLVEIDRVIAQKIFDRVEDHLAKDPNQLGKPLLYQFKGLHSYRFSRYRIVYQINNQEILITVIRVDHRRKVYD